MIEETNALLAIAEAPVTASSSGGSTDITLSSGPIGLLGYLSMLALVIFAIVSVFRMARQPKERRNPAAFLGFAHSQFLFFILTLGVGSLLCPPCGCGGDPFPMIMWNLSRVLQPFYFEFAILLAGVFTLCGMSRQWPKPSALTIAVTFMIVFDIALFFAIFILVTLPIGRAI